MFAVTQIDAGSNTLGRCPQSCFYFSCGDRSLWKQSDMSYPDCDEDGNHMCECEEDVARENGGSSINDGPPRRLVVKPLALVVVKPLILLRPLAVVAPGSVFVPAEEAQTVTSAGSSQDPSSCSCPLQAWLGEASALGGSCLVTVALPATLECASALAVGILHPWAQGCHQQQPNPEREQLLLAGH